MRDKKPFWHGRCQKGFYNQVLKLIITAVVYRPFRKNETAKSQQMTYYFDVEKCRHCPQAIGCYQSGAKSKTYSVALNSELHKE